MPGMTNPKIDDSFSTLLAAGGGIGVGDGVFRLGWVGELVEEGQDLVSGLVLQVGEELDRFLDQGVGGCGWAGVDSFGADFFWSGVGFDDLLLWLGDRRFGVDSGGRFGSGFCGFQRFVQLGGELGLGSSFARAAVEVVGGAANLADQGEELGVVELARAAQFDRRQLVAEGLDHVDLGEVSELAVEQVELFEQDVVGGWGDDLAPVGFQELQVGADGGVGDAELFGDLAQGVSLLAQAVDLEDALSALGGDVHGVRLLFLGYVCSC